MSPSSGKVKADKIGAVEHRTAVTIAAACAGLALVLRESPLVGTLGLAYCAAWFLFYAKAI